ncbi:MAG: hypothetical protein NTZ78_01305 [Candidatus Aureabacteria bacterium]|nr:hypothetical protein [Candidatus Auribacterota bacterium]
MPRYREMMRDVMDAIPFDKNDRPIITDPGCGTGKPVRKPLSAHPNAR